MKDGKQNNGKKQGRERIWFQKGENDIMGKKRMEEKMRKGCGKGMEGRRKDTEKNERK